MIEHSKKIVYITGCLGFIGSHVTRLCLNRGWYVKGIDKVSYAANTNLLLEFNQYKNFSFEKTDINDLDILYDCDYIINTAAETHVDNSISSTDIFLKSNIDGVHNLLELIKSKKGYKKPILLHFSTDEVYGDILNGSHTENDLLKPSNPYSATKAAADQLIFAWGRTYDLPYIIIRPTNNYGVGQYVEKLIPKTVKYLSMGRKIPLHDGGKPIRNWLHVVDTARGVLQIIDKNCKNEIFNICGGFEQNNLTTVSKIIKFFHGENINLEDYLDLTYNRVGQDIRYALNDQKLRNIGWTPIKNFDEELPEIINFYKNNFIW